MRLAGSTKFARVSGLGALLGDTNAQADVLITNAAAYEMAGNWVSAYTAYKQALTYLQTDEAAATAKAGASKLPDDYEAIHRIQAKEEKCVEGMTRAADKIAQGANAYAALPQLNYVDTPDAIISQSKLYKTLDILNRPFPAPLAPAPPDALYFSDKFAYLRQALNTRNWNAVQKWYATELGTKLTTTHNASQFYAISQLNLQDYCDRTFDRDDYAAFIRKCLVKFCIYDLGTYVGIGYGGSTDAPSISFGSRCSLNSPNFISGEPGVRDFMGFMDNPKLVGMDRWRAYDSCVKGVKYDFALCWLQEATKWNTTVIFETVIMAIGAAMSGYGVGVLFAPAGAAAGAGGAAAGAGAGAGGAAAAAGAAGGALAASGIETVVVTGTAIGAGAVAAGVTGATVAAGITAGAITATGAPPAISSPALSAEDTITVSSTALPAAGVTTAGSVGAGVSAGAIVATTSPPPLSAPGGDIQTITVEGTRPVLPDVPPIPTAGAVVGTGADALQPTTQTQTPSEQSTAQQVKNGLWSLIKQFGAKWVSDRLAQLLTQQLGRAPTPQELQAWQDWLDQGAPGASDGLLDLRVVLGIIGLVLAAALLTSKKKGARKHASIKRSKRK